jgi:hypothetical protein
LLQETPHCPGAKMLPVTYLFQGTSLEMFLCLGAPIPQIILNRGCLYANGKSLPGKWLYTYRKSLSRGLFSYASQYMGGPYGPFGLNMPLPLDQNPFVNTQFPFLATLELPDLYKLTNDPIVHNPTWSTVPVKIHVDILKFDGKDGRISHHAHYDLSFVVHVSTLCWMITFIYVFSLTP